MPGEAVLGSACELRLAYRARELSAVEVVAALADHIARANPILNALITPTLEQAAEEACRADQAYARGSERPLEGIPFVVKDLIDTGGIRTTYGSPIFDNHVPKADAECVARAKQAGAILLGKTNTDEFAYGITNVNPHYGAARNPWAPDRVSGGSSGGSAVAVAARLAPLALGTDTGGSIRAPASFCGIIGFKPTFGAVSALGVHPMAPSLDHPGPMTRTPADAALFLATLAESGRAIPRGLGNELEPHLRGARLGVCEDLVYPSMLSRDVHETFDRALETLRGEGAELVNVRCPEADSVFRTHATIRDAEIAYVHRREGLFPDRRDEYSVSVATRMDEACRVGLDELVGAVIERHRLFEAFERLFESVDALVVPISSHAPPPIETDDVDTVVFLEYVGRYTVPENLLGLPACAIRAGFDDLGLPVGVQLVGRVWSDPSILRMAEAYYRLTADLQARWPELCSEATRKDTESPGERRPPPG